MNTTGTKPVIVTRPDGTEVEYPSGSAAAHGENLQPMDISLMANQRKAQTRGFKARFKHHQPVGPMLEQPMST